MHWRQVLAVAACVALNSLDGFDVLAISFAAPGIATEWGITKAMLGVVLSVELFGMAIGSAALGNFADRLGRKPTIIGCLAMMAVGMFAAAMAHTIPALAAARLLTGLGIGGMIATTSAIVAETSSARRRSLNLALNIAGYSAGAILGGSVATALLAAGHNWRSVFQFGFLATLAALPLAALALRESLGFLLSERPRNALARINRVLASYAREALTELPPPRPRQSAAPIATLFTPRFLPATVLLTVAYLAQIMVFYFMQKWIPKLVVDMGHTPAEAGRVLVIANIGCLAGALAIGLVSQWLKLVPIILAAMGCAFVFVTGIGAGSWSLQQMSVICACAGFFINAAVIGLYPVMARTFPAEVRASGIGFAIGVGRGGAALGPMAAGAMLAAGYPLSVVAPVMGTGALVAGLMLVLLSRRTPKEQRA
ncbi:MAG: MFS transporter [Proteobacteria bacterium]|nr:MFS transporter [Pseudomonadota bacterium]